MHEMKPKKQLYLESQSFMKNHNKKEWTLVNCLADKELKGEPYVAFYKP